MTQTLKSTLNVCKKISLLFLILTSVSSISLHAEEQNIAASAPTTAQKSLPPEIESILAQLEKDPTLLDKNPELAQIVMEFLQNDPAFVEMLKKEAEGMQVDKESASLLEDKVKQINFLLKQVLQIIQDLSQVVSNNQLRNINKKEVLTQLQQLQHMVAEVERGPFLVVNMGNVDFLLSFTQMLTAYLRHIIKKGLKEFPEFDVSIILKRGAQRTLEDIDPTIQTIAKAIQRLQAEERQVGRNWFQQQFKKTRTFLDDYKVYRKVGYTALAGFLIWLAAAKYNTAFAKPVENGASNQKSPIDPEYIASYEKMRIDPKYTTEELTRFIQAGTASVSSSGNSSRISGQTELRSSSIPWVNSVLKEVGVEPIFNSVTSTIENLWDNNLTKAGALIGMFVAAGAITLKFDKPFVSLNTFVDAFKFQAKTWWVNFQTRAINVANYLSGDPAIKVGHSWLIEPRYTFDDIIGHEAFKQQLNRYVEYILDPDKFDRAGATPERGVLFAGPPQTGKTMLAEATAGEILRRQMARGTADKFSFLVFTPAEINENGIDFILWLAEAQAPCIVFIDELDLYKLQREGNSKMLQEFLTAMSGAMNAEKSKRIIMLGATNKPENLDQALLQHGRFGKILYFDYPIFEERKQFFAKKLLLDLGLNFNQAFIEKLTRETENCTYNDLKAIITTALDDAKVQNENITEHHLESALDEEVRNIVLQKTKLPESQKRILAVHQAGHALATMLLNTTENLNKVTIRSVTKKIQEQAVNAEKRDVKEKNKEAVDFGGVFTSPKEDASVFATKEQIIVQCKVLLAGHIAESVILGTRSSYHDYDYEKALDKARQIVFNSINDKKLPKEVKEQLGQQAYALIRLCEDEVFELLSNHKDELAIIAQALQNQQTLTAEEIETLIAQYQKKQAAEQATVSQESTTPTEVGAVA